MDWDVILSAFVNNWPAWVVTITLVVAAVIDGWVLKVPNWITFPMIISGWIYASIMYPALGYGPWWEGMLWSLMCILTIAIFSRLEYLKIPSLMRLERLKSFMTHNVTLKNYYAVL